MNKKIVGIVVCLLIIIIIVVMIINQRGKKEIDESKFVPVTQEEAKSIILSNIEKELADKGLELENKIESNLWAIPGVSGYKYNIKLEKSNDLELGEYTIEIYALLGVEDFNLPLGLEEGEEGEITMTLGEETQKAIVIGNVLIVETQNEEINKILKDMYVKK